MPLGRENTDVCTPSHMICQVRAPGPDLPSSRHPKIITIRLLTEWY